MTLQKTRNCRCEARREKYTSPPRVRAYFKEEREFLLWLALIVTGELHSAQTAVVNATEVATARKGAFADWLAQWARSATIRSSIAIVRSDIAESARTYNGLFCKHQEHSALTEHQFRLLRGIELHIITSELNTLTRAVLLLRGVEDLPIEKCAAALNVTPGTASAAYCRALHWLATRQESIDTSREVRPATIHSKKED